MSIEFIKEDIQWMTDTMSRKVRIFVESILRTGEIKHLKKLVKSNSLMSYLLESGTVDLGDTVKIPLSRTGISLKEFPNR